MREHVTNYAERLSGALRLAAMNDVPRLAAALRESWERGRAVYLCGNGGSGANAIHIANDWLFAARAVDGRGLKVEALTANISVLTSIANDLGYDQVFAEQLRVKAATDDLLVVLSGSGNSVNIIKALEMGNAKGMQTFAVLGYSGGACKALARTAIHFDVNDMQIAEDLQLIVGHICMQWLCANPVDR